ncbi:MAG: PTS system mannose/fructose/sorbose family transporter subunit IID [Desulfovibrio sp.]|nr:PTS system mannose/fructose/sorbose family transporter subunit IID [Desulfovibrio sp.]
MSLSLATVFSCLARTAAVNAAITTRGMQQIGLAYILAPALRELYPDKAARRQALARYAEHTNTHPFAQPLVAGVLINIETALASGFINEDGARKLRKTIPTALSAVGDSLFSSAVHPCWALVCCLLLFYGHTVLAAGLTIALCLLLQCLRLAGFLYGLRYGFDAILKIAAASPGSWAGPVKVVNGLLAGLALACLFWHGLPGMPGYVKAGMALCIPLASWLVFTRFVTPVVFWMAGLLLLACAGGGTLHL